MIDFILGRMPSFVPNKVLVVVLVSGVRSKTSNLVAKLRAPVRAPRPYLQRRGELVQARFGSERTPDTSTTSGNGAKVGLCAVLKTCGNHVVALRATHIRDVRRPDQK